MRPVFNPLAVLMVVGFVVGAANLPAGAAVVEDFEGYQPNESINDANSRYTVDPDTLSTVYTDATDPQNKTQVLRIVDNDAANAGGNTTFTLPTDPQLTGEVYARFDVRAMEGGSGGMILYTSSATNAGANIIFQVGGTINAGTTGPQIQLVDSYNPDHWYRVELLMHLDINNGANSTYDVVSITDLNTGTVVASNITGIDCPGAPTLINGGQFTAIMAGPAGNRQVEMRYDNFEIGIVPEPASAGLAAGAMLLLLTSRGR